MNKPRERTNKTFWMRITTIVNILITIHKIVSIQITN
jgi:hypothetical protein